MGVQNMIVLKGRYPYYSLFTNEKVGTSRSKAGNDGVSSVPTGGFHSPLLPTPTTL